jgi:thioredoxin-dependent adenylylsulfate APS reductase
MQEQLLLDEHEKQTFSEQCAALSPQDVLRCLFERCRSRVALCTSFQATGMVILDMAWRLNPQVRVFTIDTGRLPQETYDLMERVRERYGVQVEVYCPDTAQVEDLVRQHGANLFYRNPELRILCCKVRKVQTLQRALRGLEAWITGLRREPGSTRTQVRKVEIDRAHGGILKVNPLADWTEQDAWAYIRAHEVPYHALYDAGYTSIGCSPCTRPTLSDESPRAGRWWWEDNVPKECGLHYVMNADGQLAVASDRAMKQRDL